MNYKSYKSCAVRKCSSTSIKTPNKLFVYVPHKETMRKKWLEFAKRDPEAISLNSTIYFCEDHFDLPNDMDNYMEYHVMGSVSQVRMKPGCIPKKFECQSKTNNITQPNILEQQRDMLIEYTDKDLEKRSTTIRHMGLGEALFGSPASFLAFTISEHSLSHQGEGTLPLVEDFTGQVSSAAYTIDSRDDTTSEVCQVIEEDLSVAETTQTSQDDPVDIEESPHASTTESAGSSTEDTANLMTSCNNQTSNADESMDYSIDQFKCNTIISNVYRYLLKEYMSLKSQLRGICDVSVLSNTLARTAAATGVSQDEVEMALRETALHSNQPSKLEETHSSADVRRPINILRNKRRFKTLEEDKSEDSVRPPKRKATSESIPSQSSDEEQLPFPAPIQLRVMKTECKIEPVDEPPTMDDLEPEASSRCGTGEGTEMEFKTELVDDESSHNIKDDPLEWSPTALEEPSDPPDVSHTEVKSEHLDHDYADMSWGHSKYDKKHPDINPKPPSQ